MNNHVIVTFDQPELARQENRLILQNHVPKTGGTTLSHIFQNNMPGEFRLLEDMNHWSRLRKETPLLEGRTVHLEGMVWGAENVFPDPRPVCYVTIIRDPLLVFRSNFSYNRRRLFAEVDLATYLDEFKNNFQLEVLAGGDLELAKDRLLQTYSLFGITEHFQESARLFSDFFQFNLSSYAQRNKSASDVFEIDDDLRDAFRERNQKDYDFYEFAKGLFWKRYQSFYQSEAPRDAAVMEQIDDASFCAGNVYDEDPIRIYLDEERFGEAAKLLEETEPKVKHHHLALMRCYTALGEMEEAERSLKAAYEENPDLMFWDYAQFWKKANPAKAVELLSQDKLRMEDILYDNPPDMVPYFYLVGICEYLVDCYVDTGRYQEALSCVEDELGRLKRRGLSTVIDSHYGRAALRLQKIRDKMIWTIALFDAPDLSVLPENNSVAIYGTGDTGQVLFRLIRDNRDDINLLFWLDSSREGHLFGHEVLNPGDLVSRTDRPDYILVASLSYAQEMAENLKDVGCQIPLLFFNQQGLKPVER